MTVNVSNRGPAQSYSPQADYLDEVVDEVGARHRVATFQQRGLAPSTTEGEFTIAEAVGDIVAVLDELGRDTAYLMGHSWGGHLAFHAATAIPDRLSGVLAIESLGAVGDGGSAEFMAELVARMLDANRPRFDELEAKESAEGLSPEEDVSSSDSCGRPLRGALDGTGDAADHDVAVGVRRVVGRCPRAAVGARGRPPLHQSARRRARRRAQPDLHKGRHRHRVPHPGSLVAYRAGSRSLIWLEVPVHS